MLVAAGDISRAAGGQWRLSHAPQAACPRLFARYSSNVRKRIFLQSPVGLAPPCTATVRCSPPCVAKKQLISCFGPPISVFAFIA